MGLLPLWLSLIHIWPAKENAYKQRKEQESAKRKLAGRIRRTEEEIAAAEEAVAALHLRLESEEVTADYERLLEVTGQLEEMCIRDSPRTGPCPPGRRRPGRPWFPPEGFPDPAGGNRKYPHTPAPGVSGSGRGRPACIAGFPSPHTVSYTHRDVYKRQGFVRVSQRLRGAYCRRKGRGDHHRGGGSAARLPARGDPRPHRNGHLYGRGCGHRRHPAAEERQAGACEYCLSRFRGGRLPGVGLEG